MDDYQPRTVTQAYGDRDQTQPSTCYSKPSESFKRRPSAKTRDLIARLGLRYRPTNQSDLAAHASMLALLAEDLADLPINLLELAIQRHCATSPYMPKMADLIKLAQEAQGSAKPATSLQAYADDLNKCNFSKVNDWHWFVSRRTLENGASERFLDRTTAGIIKFDALPPEQRVTPTSGMTGRG